MANYTHRCPVCKEPLQDGEVCSTRRICDAVVRGLIKENRKLKKELVKQLRYSKAVFDRKLCDRVRKEFELKIKG